MRSAEIIAGLARAKPTVFWHGDGYCCLFCGARVRESGETDRTTEQHTPECVWAAARARRGERH